MAGEATLYARMELRLADAEKKLTKFQGSVDKNMASVERRTKLAAANMESSLSASAAKIGGVFKSFGAGLVAGVAAGGITGLVASVREVAQSVASVGDEAKRAGVSVKAFQELKFVAEQNRIGVDSLVDGLKELSLRADEFVVTGKGPAAEAFARLGYGSADLAAKLKHPSALFTEIIGKMGQLDKAAQIRVADEIFGGTAGERFVELIGHGEQGIRAMIQAANDGGHVLDEQLVKKAAELDAKFAAVSSTVGTALKTAIVEAAASLGRFIELFQSLENKSTETLDNNLANLGAKRLEIETEILKMREEQRNITGFFADGEKKVAEAAIKAKEEELKLLSEEERRLLSILEKRKAIASVSQQSAGIVPFSPLPADDTNRRVQLAAARDSIAKIESAGSGGYRAVGPVTANGDRAYGRYQVMTQPYSG